MFHHFEPRDEGDHKGEESERTLRRSEHHPRYSEVAVPDIEEGSNRRECEEERNDHLENFAAAAAGTAGAAGRRTTGHGEKGGKYGKRAGVYTICTTGVSFSLLQYKKALKALLVSNTRWP